MSVASRPPIIQERPILQRYYASLESRIGYWAFLGGRRHFAYYERDTYWPFPLTRALERMEEYMHGTLELEPGSRVLDAGCGEGFVACHMASKGLYVEGIDIVEHHVASARRNARWYGYDKMIKFTRADYHHLEQYADGSLDGVYVVETLCHSTDPRKVLSEFFRVIRPGGRLSMVEYEHVPENQMPKRHRENMHYMNEVGAMPALTMFTYGWLEKTIAEHGFQNVKTKDLTENTRPLLRLFFVVAIIPYLIITLLGLRRYFTNTVGAVIGYRADRKGYGYYTSFTGTKPVS